MKARSNPRKISFNLLTIYSNEKELMGDLNENSRNNNSENNKLICH
jgi:hypothetical protein